MIEREHFAGFGAANTKKENSLYLKMRATVEAESGHG